MTLDNAIKKSGIGKSLGLPEWPEAGKADASAEPCVLFAIADGLGITPEELIAAMRKEAKSA